MQTIRCPAGAPIVCARGCKGDNFCSGVSARHMAASESSRNDTSLRIAASQLTTTPAMTSLRNQRPVRTPRRPPKPRPPPPTAATAPLAKPTHSTINNSNPTATIMPSIAGGMMQPPTTATSHDSAATTMMLMMMDGGDGGCGVDDDQHQSSHGSNDPSMCFDRVFNDDSAGLTFMDGGSMMDVASLQQQQQPTTPLQPPAQPPSTQPSTQPSSQSASYGVNDFVKKLYQLLETASTPNSGAATGQRGILSWSQAGDSFIIHDTAQFASQMLVPTWHHSNFSSFTRQLNKYGFSKVRHANGTVAMGEHEYQNGNFQRGRADLLHRILRKEPRRATGATTTGMNSMTSSTASLSVKVSATADAPSSAAAAAVNYPTPVDDSSNNIPPPSMMPTQPQQAPPTPADVQSLTHSLGVVTTELGECRRMLTEQGALLRLLLQDRLQPQPSISGPAGGGSAAAGWIAQLLQQQAPQPPPPQQQQPATPTDSIASLFGSQTRLDGAAASLGPLLDAFAQQQQQQAPVNSNNNNGSSSTSNIANKKALVPAWATPPKILLVEDDDICRRLSSRLLHIFGCNFDVATDGVDAVQKMNLDRYDLVLMDIVMPNLDGVSATHHIRQFDKSTPIISMTSNTTAADCRTYFSTGMTDILAKPFSKASLFEMLERYCSHLIRAAAASAGVYPASADLSGLLGVNSANGVVPGGSVSSPVWLSPAAVGGLLPQQANMLATSLLSITAANASNNFTQPQQPWMMMENMGGKPSPTGAYLTEIIGNGSGGDSDNDNNDDDDDHDDFGMPLLGPIPSSVPLQPPQMNSPVSDASSSASSSPSSPPSFSSGTPSSLMPHSTAVTPLMSMLSQQQGDRRQCAADSAPFYAADPTTSHLRHCNNSSNSQNHNVNNLYRPPRHHQQHHPTGYYHHHHTTQPQDALKRPRLF